MSNDWNFYCVTCDAHGPFSDWNHGEDHLRDLLPHLTRIAMLEGSGLRVETENGPSSWGLLEFAVKHHTHDVRIRSEYGYFYEDCAKHVPCPTCGHTERCKLKNEHEGPCNTVIPPVPSAPGSSSDGGRLG